MRASFGVALAASVLSLTVGAATPVLAQSHHFGFPFPGMGGGQSHRAAMPMTAATTAPAPDLGDVLFGKAQPDTRGTSVPRLARFKADTGDTFVLEVVTGGPALLKYDDSGEVWALSPSTGPHGDTVYRNDVGEAMLRTTRMGGLTIFTQDKPSGIAAALDGGATDLHNMISGPIAIFKVLVQASLRASQAAGRRVPFEATEVSPGNEAVFADAANLTAQAVVKVDRKGKVGHDALQHVGKVAFFNGRPPGVRMVGDEVRVTVTPDLGFAGRPSSLRISQVLFARR